MCAELAGVRGGRARWSFSLGCARTAVGMRMRAAVLAHDRGGAGLRASALAAIAASVVLAVSGPVRYPGLRTGDSWFAFLAFLAIMLAYAVAALSLSRGRAPAPRPRGAAASRRPCGRRRLAAHLLPVSKAFSSCPWLSRSWRRSLSRHSRAHSSHDAGVGRAAALWSGLVGGLLVFIAYVTVTYARRRSSVRRQTLRDFHASGARDLVTYAVADDLGGALSMLVIIPVVALALGSLTSARASATRLAPPRR